MKNIYALIPLLTVASHGCHNENKSEAEKPNILWIVIEDISSHFGYQGEPLVHTPNVDRLALEGVAFSNAYVTAPVCSASRSAMITGMYQTSIGAHHHRSSRGEQKIHLPEGMLTVPELFREAGYYTCSSSEQFDRKGKEDYNFVYSSEQLYEATDWTERAEGQPFFAQVHLRGGKLRNVPRWYEEVVAGLEPTILVKAEDVELPPYYPDHPVFLQDWAEYLNSVQYTDMEVGLVLKRLEDEGLLENTVIFFMTDHGISQARGKQFLSDEGSRIPFIVWNPARLKPGVREDLVVHIDMAAASLQFAGIELPDYMEANPLFGNDHVPREYIICARDRCDETVDRIRSVRKENFKYIRNYYPLRPYLQPCAYKDGKPWMPMLRELDKKGMLDEFQQLVTYDTRPLEELYDLEADPYEVNNLALDKSYADKLAGMKEILEQWIEQTGDMGQFPEQESMYDSDMKVVLDGLLRRGDMSKFSIIENNIALMKRWASENR